MKVVDIHPEDLIDKLHDGTLTASERERLDVHVTQCSACSFEIAVRADLAEEAPVLAERPHLAFPGSAPRERTVAEEVPAPRISRSLRARSRRRWPLALLAAAFVLSAGGAMAAVFTGAVGGQWLGWSPQPKPAESSAHPRDVRPAAKPKRAVAAPVPAAAPPVSSAVEAIPSAAPVAAARSDAHVTESLVAVGRPSVRAVGQRPSAIAPAEPAGARSATVKVLPAVSGASGSGEASVSRSEVTPRVDAASLFADANRARRDGNAERAVGLYRALQSRYPNSSESELSRALLAQMLLDRGNPEAALTGFDRYLAADAPVLSAEALVGRARALEQLGKSSQAAAAWRQVQSRFPGSVHARLAATRLAALGTR